MLHIPIPREASVLLSSGVYHASRLPATNLAEKHIRYQ